MKSRRIQQNIYPLILIISLSPVILFYILNILMVSTIVKISLVVIIALLGFFLLSYRLTRLIFNQREELKAVFSALTEAILVLDENFLIKDINDTAIDLFRADKNTFYNQSLIEITSNSKLNEMVEKSIKEKKSQYGMIILKEQLKFKNDEFENQKFTSRDLYLQGNTALIETEDNQFRIIIVLHDITQLKILERIRRDFVANVSHELKTPITSILGFVETLKEGAINNEEDTKEFLDIIQSQSQRLDLIIKDLLTLSTLESYENTEIELEDHNLSEIVSIAVEACRKSIKDKKMAIQHYYADNLKIRVNSRLMEQALINLINNAVKYCPEESEITIYGENFQDYTLIKIGDNGPGISGKDIHRVFERFYTVNKARSRELGGTGLGLAIVKHIVLAHKGEININSFGGKGTEFTIRIPFYKRDSPLILNK